jgi:hypothetical protein
MTVVPRSPVYVDMLLHPVVQARSLRVRTEVLDVCASGAAMPSSAEPALKEILGRVISQRIGELFPAGGVPANVRLKSISFEEGKHSRLAARVEGAGSLPDRRLSN